MGRVGGILTSAGHTRGSREEELATLVRIRRLPIALKVKFLVEVLGELPPPWSRGTVRGQERHAGRRVLGLQFNEVPDVGTDLLPIRIGPKRLTGTIPSGLKAFGTGAELREEGIGTTGIGSTIPSKRGTALMLPKSLNLLENQWV